MFTPTTLEKILDKNGFTTVLLSTKGFHIRVKDKVSHNVAIETLLKYQKKSFLNLSVLQKRTQVENLGREKINANRKRNNTYYNNEKFIGETIDSVLNQTYNDYEIIVVDDGSEDGTRDALLPYMQKIRYHYKENGGLQAPRMQV